MDTFDKLEILTNSAKYDVACTSSGVNRPGEKGKLGNTVAAGLCHAFAGDGRCVTLLKVGMAGLFFSVFAEYAFHRLGIFARITVVNAVYTFFGH